MIVKQTGFLCSDNTLHATREGAQKHEVKLMVAKTDLFGAWSDEDQKELIPSQVAEFIIANREALASILHTRKPRTPKAVKPARKKTSRPVVESEVAA
jgi:hypothetical protein